MTTITQRLDAVRDLITQSEQRHDRAPGTVQLLAVSKTWPVADLREALAAGQRSFGESYLQEALSKIQALQGLAIEWHFIGPIQSNKTREIASHFAWVHSVAREKIALRLNQQRPPGLPPLNVCLQVNTSGEPSKSGCLPGEAFDLACKINNLQNLRLRGLMTIPAACDDPQQQRRPFRQLRELFEQLNRQGLALDTLSMGMSDDMDAAIAEGATLVRIGSAIFGARPG